LGKIIPRGELAWKIFCKRTMGTITYNIFIKSCLGEIPAAIRHYLAQELQPSNGKLKWSARANKHRQAIGE